jgi:hypothetical protein
MNAANQELSARIVELAHVRRRFGYRRIHDLLASEGREVNHKRVWRLYKLNELSVRKRRKAKRVNLERVALTASRHLNDTWSADFVMDALANGRRIKCLTVIDDFSREAANQMSWALALVLAILEVESGSNLDMAESPCCHSRALLVAAVRANVARESQSMLRNLLIYNSFYEAS